MHYLIERNCIDLLLVIFLLFLIKNAHRNVGFFALLLWAIKLTHFDEIESYLLDVVWCNIKKMFQLQSSSLNGEEMQKWLQGGEAAKEVVPLGYAGNPAGYESVSKHVEEMLELQSEDIAGRILDV